MKQTEKSIVVRTVPVVRTAKTAIIPKKTGQSEELITTEQGILLRQNRSIQVEGAFGVIKQDYHFKRFLTRGKEKTETQFLLLAFAFNINKLCNRLAGNRSKKFLNGV